MKLKKLLKKIDKKTNWVYDYYFDLIHAFGLFMGALILSTLITKWIFTSLENYKLIFFIISYTIFIIVSNKMTLDKGFKKRMSITAIIMGLIWIISAYLI